MRGMRIFHIATLDDWKQAQETGTYTTSTYGRTLEQEGFIHAARHDQVPTVRDHHYAEVTEPLIVLEVDTDLLDAEVREEQVGDEIYPHVYGPIPAEAVVAWRPARLPPIELGASHTPAQPPPTITVAFRGLAIILAAGTLAVFIGAVIAQSEIDDGDLPVGVSFVVWTLTGALAAAAAAAWAYAEWTARRSAPRA
jgi:uncharacterized protein (DUF952 family)